MVIESVQFQKGLVDWGQLPGRVMETEIHGLWPYLISYFLWGEALSGSFSHDLLGSFMSGHCFFSGFF